MSFAKYASYVPHFVNREAGLYVSLPPFWPHARQLWVATKRPSAGSIESAAAWRENARAAATATAETTQRPVLPMVLCRDPANRVSGGRGYVAAPMCVKGVADRAGRRNVLGLPEPARK